MASLVVNRLTNANVYLDGGTLLGKVSEVTLPQLKTIMTEHQALGMFGKLELPAGLDKLEAKFKWNSWYRDVIAAAGNPFKAHQIQVRGNIETYSAAGRSAQVPGVAYMRGTFKDAEQGTFKQHDNVDTGSGFNVTALRIEIDGSPVLEVDVLANVWKVEGEDILATYKTNLGA